MAGRGKINISAKTAIEGGIVGSFSIWHWLIVLVLIGSGIIVLAGLFIFHRQKVVDTTVPPENVPKGVN